MVRKLALASFFNGSEGSHCLSSSASMSMSMSAASFSTAASWQWPSCTQARTRSFRGDNSPEIVSMRHDTSSKREEQENGYKYSYKTSMNPAYVHNYSSAGADDCYSSSGLSDSSASQSLYLSKAPVEPAAVAVDEDEAIIHRLRSSTTQRLLFQPESTSSIVKTKKASAMVAFDGATALAIESADPFGDFRRSMEEMVLSHGADDWGWLEEMLGWYLRANDKKTHGLILGAFVDLLVTLASSSVPSSASCSSGLKQSRHLQGAKTGEQRTQTE